MNHSGDITYPTKCRMKAPTIALLPPPPPPPPLPSSIFDLGFSKPAIYFDSIRHRPFPELFLVEFGCPQQQHFVLQEGKQTSRSRTCLPTSLPTFFHICDGCALGPPLQVHPSKMQKPLGLRNPLWISPGSVRASGLFLPLFMGFHGN